MLWLETQNWRRLSHIHVIMHGRRVMLGSGAVRNANTVYKASKMTGEWTFEADVTGGGATYHGQKNGL